MWWCRPIFMYIHFITPLKLSEMQTEWIADNADFFSFETMHYTITIYRFTLNVGSASDKKVAYATYIEGRKCPDGITNVQWIYLQFCGAFYFYLHKSAVYVHFFTSFSSIGYDISCFYLQPKRHFTMCVSVFFPVEVYLLSL